MIGRKPDLTKQFKNVSAHPTAKGVDFLKQTKDEPNQAHKELAKKIRPKDLDADERKFWDRTAADMVMRGRLKTHYVDAYKEYCIVVCRMAKTRRDLNSDSWTYSSSTRNGRQFKMKPEVGQLNDDWRKWRTLIAMFGLAPSEERAIKNPLQGDMFGDGWDDI